MKHYQNDSNDCQNEKSNINNSFEDLILDIHTRNYESLSDIDENDKENEDNFSNNNQQFGSFSNFTQFGGRNKELKITSIFNLYLDKLQINGIIDNAEFLGIIGQKYRRNVGEIDSVLEFFGIIKKEKNIVKLLSKSNLDPPIQLKYLDKEIKKLEVQVQNLKEELAEIKSKQRFET